MNKEANEVIVREFYNKYEPPKYALKTVQRLIKTVPSKYLKGLSCIVLTDQSGHPRRHRLGKTKSRGRRIPQNRVLGRYYYAHHGTPAWIELFVDRLSVHTRKFAWLPFLRDMIFGYVLFHEVGHHIEATVAPEHREKEDVADTWGAKLLRNLFRKKYWYLRPIRKPLAWALRAWAKLS